MTLPRQLQGCNHLFSFLSLLASSRNGVHVHSLRPASLSFRQGLPNISRRYNSTRPQQTGRDVRHLRLGVKDKLLIRSKFDPSKPSRLRTENDINEALRAHGYVPAIDRVDEMLDMNRSPFQSKDEFDKIALGLLLKSGKTVDGGIRNPYKIPVCNSGQNPIKARNGKFPRPMPVSKLFLFPDDTNWAAISRLFPTMEPPRPWHSIVMVGLKQDYTREEVARRLEWSMVQNAKKMRNGYHWPAPDPATYEYLDKLPPPPPPALRECNVCKKPRYLLRFWNFYFQRWQHVEMPHRPSDCSGHLKGGGGRLMWTHKGAKIAGEKAANIENKEWIPIETAVKLLFRSGFITLPTVNPEIGKIMTSASVNNGEYWNWTQPGDVERWALRGGRQNGLLNLTKIKKMSQVERARKEQHEQFLEQHKGILNEVRQLLVTHPITEEQAANIPPGQLFPRGHPAIALWQNYENKPLAEHLRVEVKAMDDQARYRAKLKQKIAEVDKLLGEMKVTKAEILMLERGQGEVWVDTEFASLPTSERIAKLRQAGDIVEYEDEMPESERMWMEEQRALEKMDQEERKRRNYEENAPARYKTYDHVGVIGQLKEQAQQLREMEGHRSAPRRWLDSAPTDATSSWEPVTEEYSSLTEEAASTSQETVSNSEETVFASEDASPVIRRVSASEEIEFGSETTTSINQDSSKATSSSSSPISQRWIDPMEQIEEDLGIPKYILDPPRSPNGTRLKIQTIQDPPLPSNLDSDFAMTDAEAAEARMRYIQSMQHPTFSSFNRSSEHWERQKAHSAGKVPPKFTIRSPEERTQFTERHVDRMCWKATTLDIKDPNDRMQKEYITKRLEGIQRNLMRKQWREAKREAGLLYQNTRDVTAQQGSWVEWRTIEPQNQSEIAEKTSKAFEKKGEAAEKNEPVKKTEAPEMKSE